MSFMEAKGWKSIDCRETKLNLAVNVRGKTNEQELEKWLDYLRLNGL